MLLHSLDNSFLAGYRPPVLHFADSGALPDVLVPIWSALRAKELRPALRRGYEILRGGDLDGEVRAALLAGLASAEWEIGVAADAKRMAEESLALFGGQWLAYRVLLTAHLADHNFETARRVLLSIPPLADPAPWDEPLCDTDHHLLCAACAWMMQDWNGTAELLSKAFPAGVQSMPAELQEDWLRLAFYRNVPADASEAVHQLMLDASSEKADILIQTLVQQGWHKEALSLYRSVYDLDPQNELLRRRIVGLCIREGEVDEARRLMELGALRLAV